MAGREGQEVWSKRVARWRESGLTAKEFAAETGVNPHTLTHWAWRLGGGRGRGRPAVKRRQAAGGPQWIEVIGRGPGSTSGGTAGDGFEIGLASGRTIRVPMEFNAEALGRLLAVVDAR